MPSLIENLNTEQQILVLCTQSILAEKEEQVLQQLLEKEVNWSYLEGLSIAQNTFPLLYVSINRYCRKKLPVDIAAKWRQIYFANAAKNVKMARSLERIIELFNKNGIEAICFKGPALAEDIFGRLEYRSFSDLDILVQLENVTTVKALLEARGFSSNVPPGKNIQRNYLKSEYSITFSDSDGTLSIDLHWHLRGRYVVQAFDTRELFLNKQPVKMINDPVYTLSPEHLLVYLCMHGSKDEWRTLNHICCISELIRNKPSLDWEQVIKLSKKLKCQRTLIIGVTLVSELFTGINLSKAIEEERTKGSEVHKISTLILKRLFQKNNGRFGFLHLYYFNYLVLDSFFDRVCFCIQKVFRPAYEDVVNFNVPEAFYFLLYILRPLRLIFLIFRQLSPQKKSHAPS